MNIYEFSCHGGKTDWVFAPNMREAKDFYLISTDSKSLTKTKIKRVPKSKWNKMYLLDINESDPYNYCCGFKTIETFAEYVERNTVTDLIATTEYRL